MDDTHLERNLYHWLRKIQLNTTGGTVTQHKMADTLATPGAAKDLELQEFSHNDEAMS